MQHAGSDYLDRHNLNYTVYFVLDEIKLLGGIEFDYGGWLPNSN